jgi:cobalt-precorrin 5A hydrolase/precorrin-3B C17-methyltransferase
MSLTAISNSNHHPLGAIATTPQGIRILSHLSSVTLWLPANLAQRQPAIPPELTQQIYSGSLQDHLTVLWPQQEGIIFCLAVGAVVRLIAPLLTHKSQDPAVVVVDEAGRFVISLCGGHQGQADRLAQQVAAQLGATVILTGAANHLGLTGVDILGVSLGWQRGSGDWTKVSGTIARQDPLEVVQTAGSTLWQAEFTQHPNWQLRSTPPSPQATSSDLPQARIWITAAQPAQEATLPTVYWHPRVLWVGVGCERGSSRHLIETAILQTCQAYQLAQEAIAGIATIDRKADEVGLQELCQTRNWPMRCFTSEQLKSVPVPNPSAIVETEVGTASVAEAAAILASEPGVLRVPKQIVRRVGESGAVTVAIAQADREYTGRKGKLYLVGTGPGAITQITPAAQAALVGADMVIGYQLYVDLIRPILRPGQWIEAWPITQEQQRAERAIDLATWGLSVAVISSGDCGIYGMAGLVLECLSQRGWDGKTPTVEVLPGITAMQAAAARVGAPLMHDFCAISLSDLLTPWSVIEKRLRAAAQADFVVSLYNPKSKARTEQIKIAQQIFLQYRQKETPVALVRSAYRSQEQIVLTTLAEFLDQEIDMLTTIVIGNQATSRYGDWLITPRGYLS